LGSELERDSGETGERVEKMEERESVGVSNDLDARVSECRVEEVPNESGVIIDCCSGNGQSATRSASSPSLGIGA
jgi:hypothetical protein